MAQETIASPTGPAAPAPAGPRAGGPATHLHAVDLVRLLTFACVVGVHAVPMASDPADPLADALVVLLHFTRDTFFLLSAFVLVHVHYRRELRVGPFWARRFFYIGVPYLVWTAIYWALNTGLAQPGAGLRTLGYDLLAGTAEYHLYFLLVSMQLYLAFPLLLALLRRTRGHHVLLFGVSLTLQVALLWAILWRPWPGGVLAQLQAHAYALLPTYQFYFVAGGLAAVHYRRFADLVTAHRGRLLLAVPAAAVAQEAVYALRLAHSGSPAQASDPLQPTLVLWSVVLTVGLFAVGGVYAAHRRGGRLARFVDRASTVSFGVYLMHPLVLNHVLDRWLSYPSGLPGPVAGALAWTVPLAASFAVMAVVVRTPLALPLTGRRRQAGPGPAGSGRARPVSWPGARRRSARAAAESW